MKKYLPTILILSLILIVGAVFLAPHAALAVTSSDNSTTPSSGTFLSMGMSLFGVNNVLAYIANALLSITAWFLTICGTFLSISINLTIHIQQIFFAGGSTVSSIQTVWVVVRDLSSIFIIFSLLYCSIMTILGQAKTGINQLVVQIFLAGMLINFSLFFVKVAVDASNLISLQFYNAIAPQTSSNFSATSAYYDGGLSNIFMQSLKLPTVYNKGVLKGNGGDVALSILTAAVGGIIMMATAAFSFLAASIAFTARTAIILFVMALSPFFFAGMIFPKIKEKVSDPLLKLLKGQLVFMPVYLFLLYVALRLISDPMFMTLFQSKPAGSVTEGVLGSITIGVILQYVIAIIFINAPLVAAISLGGVGMKWAPTAKDISTKIGGFLGRNTYGNLASKVADSNWARTAASKSVIAAGTLRQVRGIAGDYNENAKKKAEEKAKFGESLGYNKRTVAGLESEITRYKNEIDTEKRNIENPTVARDPVALAAAKASKKNFEGLVREAEKKLAAEKRRRQETYASRLDPRDIDPLTGKLKPMSPWERIAKGGYIGTKNESAASAQIHIKNVESDIEQIKKTIDDKKKEQDTLKADIKRIDEQERQGRFNSVTDPAHPQAVKRNKLKDDLFELLNGDPTIPDDHGLTGLQQDVRNKELELKTYKNNA